jgi:hypothetical protein
MPNQCGSSCGFHDISLLRKKKQYLRLLPLFSAALFATFETTTFFSSPMLFTIVLRLLARKISFLSTEQGSFWSTSPS